MALLLFCGPGIVAQPALPGLLPGTAAQKSALLSEHQHQPEDMSGVTRLVYVRRVRGFNIWIWYRDTGAFVELIALTSEPPGA